MQTIILFSLYKIKYPFCVSDINCIIYFFLCTSYFSLCLIWNEYLDTRHRSNVWKPGWKQADTCNMFTLFQNFADLCLKDYPLFLDFANSPLPLTKYPFLRNSGYEHCIRFDRKCGVGAVCTTNKEQIAYLGLRAISIVISPISLW